MTSIAASTFLKQPPSIRGDINGKTYRNSFYRSGRPLHSTVVMERGILHRLGEALPNILPERSLKAQNFLITDTIVDRLLGDIVLDGFRAAEILCHKIVVPSTQLDETGNPSTERYKTLETFTKCTDEILSVGMTKHSCVISLGGGVVNNLCGFIAASLYRGIPLVHITTTMMGMTDAAIDFKQAVNHCKGKNLLGCYYPASVIVVDTDVLKSLSNRHILNGLAEALKHALAQSVEFTELIRGPLREYGKKALEDADYLERVCRTCIDYKVPTLIHYVESDFNEMVPQYGHQFGHAIEHLSFKSGAPLLHGEGVSIGMCLSAEVAHILGIASKPVVDAHYAIIADCLLPTYVPDDLDIDEVVEKMSVDKHYVRKESTMGLLQAVGHMAVGENGSFSFKVGKETLRLALECNVARRDRRSSGKETER